jgi:hypothetical protein
MDWGGEGKETYSKLTTSCPMASLLNIPYSTIYSSKRTGKWELLKKVLFVPQCMTNWYDHSDAQEQRKPNSWPLSSNGYATTQFLSVGT